MGMLRFIVLANLALIGAPAASVFEGDARRGADLFTTEMCIRCHKFKGQGGGAAPDLGQRTGRDYTPAVMASRMWNHAPAMWGAAGAEKISLPPLSPEQAADLFAFFYSARYFEKPGDAARGKQLFTSKHCAECHAMSSPTSGAPVTSWQFLSDPIVLLQRMWNHTAQMRQAFAQKKIPWSRLTSQEMTDLLVYLQNLPQMRGVAPEFSLARVESGKALFEAKGCAGCHHGKLALENRLVHRTLTDIATAMWNHAPDMVQKPPALQPEEMRQIVGYVWGTQFFNEPGHPARGKQVFTQKKCAVCHDDPSSGAPALARGKDGYSSVNMVSVLWKHGPRMLERMKEKNLPWPRMTAADISNLVSYLNAAP